MPHYHMLGLHTKKIKSPTDMYRYMEEDVLFKNSFFWQFNLLLRCLSIFVRQARFALSHIAFRRWRDVDVVCLICLFVCNEIRRRNFVFPVTLLKEGTPGCIMKRKRCFSKIRCNPMCVCFTELSSYTVRGCKCTAGSISKFSSRIITGSF